MTDSATSWQTYEQVATYLLNRVADSLGLQFVEGKQAVVGLESGTSWEMDAKGICSDGVGFVLIEIKRYATRKINQRDLGAVAYQIRDVGASGGIVVTPLGLQEGAKKVAAAAQIVSVQLNENSTTTQYVPDCRFGRRRRVDAAEGRTRNRLQSQTGSGRHACSSVRDRARLLRARHAYLGVDR